MPEEKKRRKMTLGKLRGMKRRNEPITWLTCYDYPMAQIMDASGQKLFLTAGEKEVRTWMIRKGETAVEAAGNIHTDMARGFIRAEVIQWDELLELGSWNAAKDAGKMRVEGKDYVVQDGDVVHFRVSA